MVYCAYFIFVNLITSSRKEEGMKSLLNQSFINAQEFYQIKLFQMDDIDV